MKTRIASAMVFALVMTVTSPSANAEAPVEQADGTVVSAVLDATPACEPQVTRPDQVDTSRLGPTDEVPDLSWLHSESAQSDARAINELASDRQGYLGTYVEL